MVVLVLAVTPDAPLDAPVQAAALTTIALNTMKNRVRITTGRAITAYVSA